MSYYDDLGVSPSALTAEIRESYRSLVRLLHPDTQTDPQLKQAAELQMKRLNHIHAVLTDPDRRRRYDAECAEGTERLAPIIIRTPPAEPSRNPGLGTLAWVGAALACGVLIAWLATRDGSTSAVAYVESIPKGVAREVTGGHSEKTSNAKIVEALRSQLRQALADRDAARFELARMRSVGGSNPRSGRTHEDSAPVLPASRFAELPVRASSRAPGEPSHAGSAALIAPSPPVIEPEMGLRNAQPLSALSQPAPHNLAGFWVFPRKKLTNRDKALYPPEYIETIIVEENGGLRGKYKARYMVSDRAISPDVMFEFSGKPSASPAEFAWTGAGGSKGEVKLKLISDKSMEVVWVTTHLGKVPGLASGTAVLVRRPDDP